MLRDYEHALFGHTSVKQLLKGLAKVLTWKSPASALTPLTTNLVEELDVFQKIVSHFYLVE